MIGSPTVCSCVQTQIKAGVEDKTIARYIRSIKSDMPDQHRKFFVERSLVYIAVETEDAGAPVATGVLAGPTGAL